MNNYNRLIMTIIGICYAVYRELTSLTNKNAPIILLDEATASLDVENETLIQTALSRLIADKTVLVIAHRMRTVAGADKIVVLSDGTVAEEGSPKDLEEKKVCMPIW